MPRYLFIYRPNIPDRNILLFCNVPCLCDNNDHYYFCCNRAYNPRPVSNYGYNKLCGNRNNIPLLHNRHKLYTTHTGRTLYIRNNRFHTSTLHKNIFCNNTQSYSLLAHYYLFAPAQRGEK